MSIETLQVTRGSRASIIATCFGAIVLIILIAAPWWAGRADMRLMSEILLYYFGIPLTGGLLCDWYVGSS